MEQQLQTNGGPQRVLTDEAREHQEHQPPKKQRKFKSFLGETTHAKQAGVKKKKAGRGRRQKPEARGNDAASSPISKYLLAQPEKFLRQAIRIHDERCRVREAIRQSSTIRMLTTRTDEEARGRDAAAAERDQTKIRNNQSRPIPNVDDPHSFHAPTVSSVSPSRAEVARNSGLDENWSEMNSKNQPRPVLTEDIPGSPDEVTISPSLTELASEGNACRIKGSVKW
ncbi:hypothetical protein MMC07_007023 [Pseudocyphellaria aurata]|nr:hypothetical protein [Pseudocyphellaria aurata]